jgi:hypothetical protein
MRQGISLKGVLLGAGLTTVLFLATAASATTRGAIREVLDLGRANSVNATTTLEGSSPKTLQLQNSGPGPALGLHVQNGEPPIATNSDTEVQHLNSALVDGENASEFQQKSDDVRLSSVINIGSETSFEVGPLVTLEFSCTGVQLGTQATLSLLNNAPPKYGNWYLTDAELDSTAIRLEEGAINSGDLGAVSTTIVQQHFNNEDFLNLVWQDSTETITATYDVQAYDAGSCSLFGTAVRTT